MTVLIIEDEPQAAQRLEHLLRAIRPSLHVVARLDSVKRSVAWFKENPPPELIFMDIQLADGISFQIFKQCHISAPVIFTTAYDAYALKAFKVNSIDYILKPFDRTDLEQALRKYESMHGSGTVRLSVANLEQAMQMMTKKYKTRFVIKVGEHIRSVDVAEALYFVSHEKATFCFTRDKRRYIVDFSLDQLEGLLDPDRFFRINRKYMVSVEAIGDMISYTNSRLKLVLAGSDDGEVIVARERVQDFRQWLDR